MVLFAVVLGLIAQEQARVLDLTRRSEAMMPSIEPRNVQNCRSEGRGAGRSAGAPPFAIAIESIDKAEYSMGRHIVVNLRLTNTSRQSLPIPTVFLDQFVDPFEGDDAGPGETMKIHFPGDLVTRDGPTAPPTVEGSLFASLLVSDGECRFWNPVRSNGVNGVRFIGR